MLAVALRPLLLYGIAAVAAAVTTAVVKLAHFIKADVPKIQVRQQHRVQRRIKRVHAHKQ